MLLHRSCTQARFASAHSRGSLRLYPPVIPRLRQCPRVPHAVSRQGAEEESSLGSAGIEDGQDFSFYKVLGVAPHAPHKEIKRAYHSLMREYHPDTASAETAEFAVLLNMMYETLSDPDKRAIYDAISGFSSSGVNPFLDTEYPRDQAFVDEVSCIGCGKCVRACSKTFEIEDSKYGRARVINQLGDPAEEIQVAIDSCPVDCIHWVTLPQLSLLEAALTTMKRVEVHVMQRRGGGGNVFAEAMKAWQKRRGALLQTQSEHRWVSFVDGFFWSAPKNQGQATSRQDDSLPRDANSRQVANLAAAAARAARMWRKYSRAKRVLRMLSETSSCSAPAPDSVQ